MHMTRYWIIIILFFVSSISCSDSKNGKKESLQMQEMCSKSAKDFFNKNYPESNTYISGIDDTNAYTNHYNSKLNKCFIVINTHRGSGSGVDKIISDATLLYDVYENKEYASLSTGSHRVGDANPSGYCHVLEEECKDRDFQSLIKPYMEE